MSGNPSEIQELPQAPMSAAGRESGWEELFRRCEQFLSLEASDFARLPSVEQVRVLKTLHYAATGRAVPVQPEDSAVIDPFVNQKHPQKIRFLEKVAALGVPCLEQDQPAQTGQEMFSSARLLLSRLAGSMLNEDDVDRYQDTMIQVGPLVFDLLLPDGQEGVLNCLYMGATQANKQRFTAKREEKADDEIRHREIELGRYEQIANLGTPIFSSLSESGKDKVINALNNAGYLRSIAGFARQACQHYETVVALCESCITESDTDPRYLRSAGKDSRAVGNWRSAALFSMNNAAIMKSNGSHWEKKEALVLWETVATRGAACFASLNSNGQFAVLQALFLQGAEHQAAGDDQAALQRYDRASELAELTYRSTGSVFHSLVLLIMKRANGIRKWDTATHGAVAILGASLAWAVAANSKFPTGWKTELLAWLSENGQNQPDSAYWSAAIEAARLWSETFGNFPGSLKLQHPEQRRLALTIIEGVVARQHRCTLGQIAHLLAVTALSARRTSRASAARVTFCGTHARMLCRQRGWPAGAHVDTASVLFAMLWALWDTGTVRRPRIENADWTPSQGDILKLGQTIAALVTQKKIIDFNPYWKRLLFRSLGKARRAEVLGKLDALRLGGDDAMAPALQAAWRAVRDAGRWQGRHRETWTPAIEELGAWLAKWSNNVAADTAIEALVFADTDELAAGHLELWLKTHLESAKTSSEHDKQLSLFLKLVIDDFDTPETHPVLLQQLHDYAQAEINAGADDAPRAWHYLEAARVALATASQKDAQFGIPDEATATSLREATLSALRDAERALGDIRQDRQIVTPGNADVPIEPFATLGRHMQRLGYRLNLTTPEDAASLLGPNENLVQLWWDANGQGQALWLSKATGVPRSLKLPQDLASPAWDDLSGAWERALQSGIDYASLQDSAQARRKLKPMLASIQAAWDAAVAADAAPRRLLRWLEQVAPEAVTDVHVPQRIVLLFPARLASLPWFALLDEPTAPIRIELAVSVGAWVKARRRTGSGNPKDSASGCVAIDSEDGAFSKGSYGWEHAQRVSLAFCEQRGKWLGALLGFLGRDERRKIVAANAVAVLRALQSPGPTHLLVHGKFDLADPGQSYLKLSVPLSRLPAWMLGGCPVQGDISLAACTSMQTGEGQDSARYLGPSGIGALLSAAGARSVVGPLWIAHDLAAMVFYTLWFEKRRTLDASTALLEVQQWMRCSSAAQVSDWVRQNLPEQSDKIKSYIAFTTLPTTEGGLGWSGPFAHPWCWAGYTLLGNPPPLPALRHPFTTRLLRRLQMGWQRWRGKTTPLANAFGPELDPPTDDAPAAG